MAVSITSFTSATPSINIGFSTTLTPVFSGGVGILLSGPTGSGGTLQGLPVESNEVVTVKPNVPYTYILMVSDGVTSQSVTLNLAVVIPPARVLAVTTGSGIISPGTNDYYCNGPVYLIRVRVTASSLSDHIAHTNEDDILYEIIFNNTGTEALYITGRTNLNLVLAKFGLTWA